MRHRFSSTLTALFCISFLAGFPQGEAANAQEVSELQIATRIVVDGDRFTGKNLDELKETLRVVVEADRLEGRDVEVALHAVQGSGGRVLKIRRSRAFGVAPRSMNVDYGDFYINVDYGDFFDELGRLDYGRSGIRLETLRPVSAEEAAETPRTVFGGRGMPPLLLVALPTDPEMRKSAIAYPLALWPDRSR